MNTYAKTGGGGWLEGTLGCRIFSPTLAPTFRISERSPTAVVASAQTLAKAIWSRLQRRGTYSQPMSRDYFTNGRPPVGPLPSVIVTVCPAFTAVSLSTWPLGQ